MTKLSRFLLAVSLTIPVLATGCAEHRTVYAWGPAEQPYYVRWEHETHRDHVEWERRNEAERHEYWEWRKHHQD
jgi:hypothetical protein